MRPCQRLNAIFMFFAIVSLHVTNICCNFLQVDVNNLNTFTATSTVFTVINDAPVNTTTSISNVTISTVFTTANSVTTVTPGTTVIPGTTVTPVTTVTTVYTGTSITTITTVTTFTTVINVFKKKYMY